MALIAGDDRVGAEMKELLREVATAVTKELRLKITCSLLQGIFKCKERVIIRIRSLTPQQAAGNALARHFQCFSDASFLFHGVAIDGR
ncbi:MAG: hypothetical protein JRC92_09940 [Deltaproteobacteria bacterium]|nr:hypothetical protein [Deltaproteobacteria bacterium]